MYLVTAAYSFFFHWWLWQYKTVAWQVFGRFTNMHIRSLKSVVRITMKENDPEFAKQHLHCTWSCIRIVCHNHIHMQSKFIYIYIYIYVPLCLISNNVGITGVHFYYSVINSKHYMTPLHLLPYFLCSIQPILIFNCKISNRNFTFCIILTLPSQYLNSLY